MSYLDKSPQGAQAYIDGQFYKIGLRNKPYVWREAGQEWVYTTKDIHDIKKAINTRVFVRA